MNTFFTLENQYFLSALLKVIGVADAKNPMSSLSNVLLEKQNGELVFTATDTEIQVSTAVNESSFAPGENQAITINAKKLASILKSFNNNADIELKLSDDDEKATILCNRSRFQLQTLPPKDFPKLEMENDEETKTLTISQMEFKKLLKQTSFAASTNDIRYYLNGVFFEIEKHKISLVATDGHRLAYASQTFEDELFEKSAIIPRKTILELLKLLPESVSDLDITISNSQIKFEFNGITLISKLIDGKFPDYKGIIPTDFNYAVAVDKLDLIKTIQRSAIVSTQKDSGVSFELSNGNLKISVRNFEDEEFSDDIPVDYHGEELTIGFNSNYILDKLNNTLDDIVIMRFVDKDSSAMITGISYKTLEDLKVLPTESNGDNKETDYDSDGEFILNRYEKYIVMPMRV